MIFERDRHCGLELTFPLEIGHSPEFCSRSSIYAANELFEGATWV